MQFRLAYVAPESRVVGAGELVDHPKKIAMNYIKGKFFVDLLVVLPLPQVRPLSPGSHGQIRLRSPILCTTIINYLLKSQVLLEYPGFLNSKISEMSLTYIQMWL